MKYYEKMLSIGCFTFSEAIKIIGSESATLSILNQYEKKGYIRKIRRGLYTALNLYDHEPIVNRFEIASHLTESSYISHHSAFEYYGYVNQVSYVVNVTSENKFNPFTFDGYEYKNLAPRIKEGVNFIGKHIKVTDIERTILDSINDFNNIMGFEELIQCISMIPVLNENKLMHYLSLYNKSFLYQKTGFIMEHFKDEFSISNDFLSYCKYMSKNSSRYLLKDIGKTDIGFSNAWRLTIPNNLWENIEGVNIYENV